MNPTILPKQYQAKEINRELESEANKVKETHNLSKWLQDPHIRRQASMQIQRMNIICAKVDNEQYFKLQIKQKHYDQL